MYKEFQNKKYYLAFETFPESSKNLSDVYLSGVSNWDTHDMYNYSIVIWRFRIIFGVKRFARSGESK